MRSPPDLVGSGNAGPAEPEAPLPETPPHPRAGLLRRLLSADRVGYAAVQSVLLQGLTISANLFTGVITARMLGAAGRGVYAAAITWPSLLGMVATAGSASAVLVYVRRERDASAAITAWGATVGLGLSTLLAALAAAAMPLLLGPQHQAALPIARAALIFAHVTAMGVLLRSVFAGQGRFLLSNLAGVLPHGLHAAAVGGFALAGALTVETAVASPIIGGVLTLILLLPFLLKEMVGPLATLKLLSAPLRGFAWRAAAANLFILMSGWADRLLLIPLLSPRDLGLYVVAFGFSRVVTLATPATGILLSAMSDGERSTAKKLHDMALRFSIASLAAALLGIYLLDAWLIGLFYGSQFLAAVACFRILAVQAAAARIANISAEFYLASDRPALNSWIGFADVATSAILLIALAPAYGPVGAAIAMLAGSGLRLGLLWLGILTHLRLPFPRLWPCHDDLHAIRALFRS